MTRFLAVHASTADPNMRQGIEHSVGDPFLYLESAGTRAVVVRALESQRMEAVPGLQVHTIEALMDRPGVRPGAGNAPLYAEVLGDLGASALAVPPDFPVALADDLRHLGITLEVDADTFVERRRRKSDAQVEGARRAGRAAMAGVSLVSDALARAEVGEDGQLHLDGEPLTCEWLKVAIRHVWLDMGCEGSEMIVAHGPQTCIGHHSGSGVIRTGEPVTVDICPRDLESGIYSDVTRTFVHGEVNDELQRYYEVVKRSYDLVIEHARPGITAAELHRISAEPIAEAGFRTQLDRRPGEVLLEGYFHSLGHGIGLDIHEFPALNQNDTVLQAGEILAVEPGCYRQGFGGVRLEDCIVLTEDGNEVLTEHPFELTPVAMT